MIDKLVGYLSVITPQLVLLFLWSTYHRKVHRSGPRNDSADSLLTDYTKNILNYRLKI